MFALLCRDGMGGFNGFTYDAYEAVPDRLLRDSYFAERTDDHELVPLRQRRLRWQADELTGSLERAGRELPSREELRIPPEAFSIHNRMLQCYVHVFWQTWRKRQKMGVLTEDGQPISDDYIWQRFRKAATGE